MGFGDPIFSKAQLTEAEQHASDPPLQVAELDTAGSRFGGGRTAQLDNVNSANLALLPRLPDTAEESKSIALAPRSRSGQGTQARDQANETTVKSTDLSRYKIIVFATHGLVPGELNGLTPAGARALGSRGCRRGGGRAAHDGGNPCAQAQCRLGRALGVQHRYWGRGRR